MNFEFFIFSGPLSLLLVFISHKRISLSSMYLQLGHHSSSMSMYPCFTSLGFREVLSVYAYVCNTKLQRASAICLGQVLFIKARIISSVVRQPSGDDSVCLAVGVERRSGVPFGNVLCLGPLIWILFSLISNWYAPSIPGWHCFLNRTLPSSSCPVTLGRNVSTWQRC